MKWRRRPTLLVWSIMVVIAGACAAGAFRPDREAEPDPLFASAVARAVAVISDRQEREAMRVTLEGIRRAWVIRPAYVEVRERISQLPDAIDYVRLEYGSAYGSTYHVFWYLRSEDGSYLLSKTRSSGPIEVAKIASEEWEEVSAVVGDFAETGCRSEYGVSDGLLFYLDARVSGATKASVAYGVPPAVALDYSPECQRMLTVLLHSRGR